MKNICAGLAFMLTQTATLALAQDIAPEGAVACVSHEKMSEFLDARDNNDRDQLAELFKGECRHLDGSPYTVIEDRNGSLKILVFRKADDWESAEAYYTLDEFLQID